MPEQGRRRLPHEGGELALRLKERNQRWWLVSLVVTLILISGVYLSVGIAAHQAERVTREARTEEAQRQVSQASVLVDVTADGIILDGELVLRLEAVPDTPVLEDLLAALRRSRSRGHTGRRCLVRADKKMMFVIVKRVMNTCVAAGYDDVSISTARR